MAGCTGYCLWNGCNGYGWLYCIRFVEWWCGLWLVVLYTVCGVVVMVMADCTVYCLWNGGNGYGWLYCILFVEWW